MKIPLPVQDGWSLLHGCAGTDPARYEATRGRQGTELGHQS